MSMSIFEMFYFVVIVYISEYRSLGVSFSSGLDLELCLGKFDIHTSTIIRTNESQALGGKYLQGLELSSMEECQRLCCETAGCDVYIFEKKDTSYCYLFECGPANNFHCTFSRHANYTSAVFNSVSTLSQTTSTTTTSAPITATREPSSVPEWELINLKLKPDVRILDKMKESTRQTAGSTSKQNAKCGRFQFQCHSGECIAIYNACDKIVQCEDGSDEGEECTLANSSARNDAISNITMQHPNVTNILIKNISQKALPIKQKDHIQLQNLNNANKIVSTYTQTRPSVINNREDAAVWTNRNLNSLNQQDIGDNFNHKLGGINIPIRSPVGVASGFEKNQQVNFGPMYTAMQENGIYVPTPVQSQHLYLAQQPHESINGQIIPENNWHQLDQHIQPGTVYVINPSQQQDQLPMQTQTKLLLKPLIEQPQPLNSQDMPHIVNIEQQINSQQIQPINKDTLSNELTMTKTPKYNKELRSDSETSGSMLESGVNQGSLLPQPIAPATTSVVHEQYKMLHDSLSMEFTRDHDGKSERPGGAVLSLTLGILITAALGVVISCRMRTVNKVRIRRGASKTPLTHEADFLVNGMYL